MLSVHLHDVLILRSDLDLLLADIALIKEGNRVIYAPDFSEFFALLHPNETRKEFRIFSDDNIDECDVAQNRALQRLFFSKDISTCLLPPYCLELEVWSQRHKQETLQKVGKLAKRAAKEIRRIVARPKFLEICRVLEQGTDISPRDEKTVVEFFSSEAGHLVSLLYNTDTKPFKKIREYLESPSFVDVKEVLEEDDDFDDDTYSRWVTGLNTLRRKEKGFQSINDALAVAQCFSANASAKKVVCRIVTRSSTMDALAKSNRESAYWNDAHGNPIRHPRLFCFLHALELSNADGVAREGKKLIRSIDRFLESYNELGPSRDSPLGDIESIKDYWHQGSQIATSLSAADHLDRAAGGERVATQVVEFLSSVRDRQSLRKLLIDQVSVLLTGIENEYMSLGWALEASTQDHQLQSRDVRARKSGDDSIIFSSWKFQNPYHMYFYSRGIQWVFGRINELGVFDVSEVATWLSRNLTGKDPSSLHERLLLMAYTYTIWDQWTLAKTYADAAIGIVDRSSRLPTYEARFLQALCLTRPRAKSGVTRAVRILNELEGQRKDPRIEAEFASICFRFSSEGLEGINEEQGQKRARRALKLSEDLKLDDLPLTVSVINNLCYYYANAEPSGRRASIYRNRLDKARRKILGSTGLDAGSDRSLHVAVADTLIWSEWKTRERSLSASDRRDLVDAYKRLLNREMTGQHKRVVEAHMAEIEGSM